MKEVKATEKPLPKRLTNGSQDKAQSYEVPHGRAEGTDIGSNRASLCASKKPSQWGGGGISSVTVVLVSSPATVNGNSLVMKGICRNFFTKSDMQIARIKAQVNKDRDQHC